jgi:hypothetical protein
VKRRTLRRVVAKLGRVALHLVKRFNNVMNISRVPEEHLVINSQSFPRGDTFGHGTISPKAEPSMAIYACVPPPAL